MNYFFWLRKSLVKQLFLFDSSQTRLPKGVLEILYLQYQLINISYVPMDQIQIEKYPHVRMMQLIGRPQLLVQLEGIEYATLIICLLYFVGIFVRFRFRQYIALFASLLDLALLNFLVEQQITILQLVNIGLLTIITLSREFITRCKNDINIINTDYLSFNFFYVLLKLIALTQIVMNYISYSGTCSLVFANSIFFCILNIKFHTKKSLITVTGFCIQLTTIYYSLLIYTNTNAIFTADIIFLPFIYKIGNRLYSNLKQYFNLQQAIELMSSNQINQIKLRMAKNSKLLNHEQQIILASICIADSPLEALKYLLRAKTNSERNILRSVKITELINKTLQSLKQKLEATRKSQDQYIEFGDLLKREQIYHLLYLKITEIIELKMKLLQNFALKNQSREYYLESINALDKILNLRDSIALERKTYPCTQTRSLYIFYLAEILNDFMGACQEIASLDVSVDNFKGEAIKFGNIDSYMITEYDQDLLIKTISQKFADIMNRSSEQLIGQKIDQFVPFGVREHHGKLIDHFLLTGQSKFYKTTDDIIIQLPAQNCISSKLSFDISFTNDKIIFISLLRETFDQPYCMIVDSDDNISAYSDSLKQYLFDQNVIRSVLGRNIHDVIPSMRQIKENDLQYEESLLIFGNVKILAQVKAQERVLESQPAYTFITFLYPRRLTKLLDSNFMTQSPQQMTINDEMDEQEKIDLPEGLLNEITDLMQMDSKRDSQHNSLLMANGLRNDIYNDIGVLIRRDASPKSQVISQTFHNDVVDDRSSLRSSSHALRSSIYYKKYLIIQRINNLSGQSKQHNLHFIFLIASILCCLTLGIVVKVIYISQQLIKLEENIQSMVSEINLLQIKNIATQPIESFVLTRYTIRNYNNLLEDRVINQTYYNQLVSYPRSNLADGYDVLKQNFESIMNHPGLQDYMIETSNYQIFSKSLGRKTQTITMQLRNFVDTLLSYQFTTMMAYQIDGLVETDSPHVVFQFKNYHQMKSEFQKVNNLIYDDSLLTISQVQEFKQIVIIMNCSFLFIGLIAAYYFRSIILLNCDKYYQILTQSSENDINNQIKRLKALQGLVKQDYNHIFKYKLNLEQFEKTLIRIDHHSERRRISTRSFTKFTQLPFILLMIVTLSDSLATFLQSDRFLQKYPQTIQLYWEMSDIGTDVPTMYAQRETLYFRDIYEFLNSTDFDNIWSEVMSALLRTQKFISLDYPTDLVISSSFLNTLNSYDKTDLCPLIPENVKYLNQTILCKQVLSGNMQNGLKPLLIYLTNQIQNDQQLNNFTTKTYYNLLEFEGVYMVSQLIRKMNDDFRLDLLNETNTLISQIEAYNIVYFILLGIFLVSGISYAKNLIRHYYYCQRLVFLAPINTLFLDDQFERNINVRIIYDLLN